MQKYISDDLQPTRKQDLQGSWKLGEDFFKFIYKQRTYILALEYRSVRLHEDEERG